MQKRTKLLPHKCEILHVRICFAAGAEGDAGRSGLLLAPTNLTCPKIALEWIKDASVEEDFTAQKRGKIGYTAIVFELKIHSSGT
jgi:hypothetical protein